MALKPIQILTEESIKTLEHAIKWISTVDELLPSDTAKELVKGLKGIVNDVKE